jgi:hypothetical protein
LEPTRDGRRERETTVLDKRIAERSVEKGDGAQVEAEAKVGS